MPLQFSTSHVADSISLFRQYKNLAERAMEQLTDEQLLYAADSESNSIAIIVKHLAGNMRSRWTDFLTSDGEKPHRTRDREFEDPPHGRDELIRIWEEGWNCVFTAIADLDESQLSERVPSAVKHTP